MTTSPMPSEMSIRDFLEAIASAEGVHGAASAATVAGGIGTSILRMVAAVPKKRAISADDRASVIEAAAALADLQQELLDAMETETAVKIFAARNMPQSRETQRHERQAALQLALRAAAEVPLEVMRLCDRGLMYAATVARCSSHVASVDVQLAIALLETAFNGARTNLEAKLSIVADAEYVTVVINEIARLTEEAVASARAARSHLHIPPA